MGILGKDKEDSIIWNMGMEIEKEEKEQKRIKELEEENEELKRLANNRLVLLNEYMRLYDEEKEKRYSLEHSFNRRRVGGWG